jgi:NAD(P)-dependent dehydrogenase (short-subunit alcohol dehydrogenase family)
MEPTGIAVVTGASRGIGRAVAVELARRGFEVVATMRNPEDGARLEGVRVAHLDVTHHASIELPEGLRVLVNNAGIEREYLPLEVAPDAMWREIFDTNVFGLAETTRRAIPLMRSSGSGVICNITTSSLLAPMPFYGAYRASKAAVSALTESLRAELAPFGIRVVEILPGPIATDMYAASERPPEAIEHQPYRVLAQRVLDLRRPLAGQATPAADAARAIVDAIMDDGGPMRYGCDRLSDGMLDAWRSSTDEEFMTGMLRAFLSD